MLADRLMERTSPPRHRLIEAAARALVDPVFVLDREGRYLEVFGGTDREAYDSPNYLLGSTLHEQMSPKLADVFLDTLRRVLDSRRPRIREFRLSAADFAGNRNDGPKGEQWFEARIAPVHADADELPECVVWTVINISQRKQIEAELQRLATRDELTGMLNRRAFLATLDAAMRQARDEATPLVLAILDLDYFKTVNDRFGHMVGDAVLRHLSERLLRSADGALLGRLGGEEFGVLLTRGGVDTAMMVLQTMKQSCEQEPFHLGDTPVPMSFSAGVAALQPEQDEQPSDLLRRADRSMYLAKNAGRGHVVGPDCTLAPAQVASASVVLSADG